MMSNAMNARATARETKKQVDAEFYECELCRLHELFSDVLQGTEQGVRRDAACMIVTAAGVFERDAVRTPTRAKHAVRLLKEAIFMLDPKVST